MDILVEKKKITKSKIAIAIVFFLLISLIVYKFALSGVKSKLDVDKERIIVSVVKNGVFQESIPINGIVLPITTIFLDALEGGRVEEVFVEDGSILKKNEPILRLSNTDLELELINQEISVYNLLTQMQISQNSTRQNTINKLNQQTDVKNEFIESERVYKLNQLLYEQNVISQQEFKTVENNYNYHKQKIALIEEVLYEDSISINLEKIQSDNSSIRIQSALQLMRKKVGDLVVRAPVAGQLTSLDAIVGQSINKGERLGHLDVLSGFKIRVDIDEHYIPRIYAGQYGSISINDQTYRLVVKKVYTQVSNRKFQVDMHFENSVPKGIRRGQSLQIRLALNEAKQAILLPKGGFYLKTGGNWIFKLSDDGKLAHKIDIVLGSQNTEYYEILQGLNPEDRVITSSYDSYENIQELELK